MHTQTHTFINVSMWVNHIKENRYKYEYSVIHVYDILEKTKLGLEGKPVAGKWYEESFRHD